MSCGGVKKVTTEDIGFTGYSKSTVTTYKSTESVLSSEVIGKLIVSFNKANLTGFSKDIIDDTIDMISAFPLAKKIIRGEVRKGILAALLYESCKINGSGIKPKEIATAFDIDQDKFSEGNKKLKRLIDEGRYIYPARILHKIDAYENRDEGSSMRARFTSTFRMLDIDDLYIEFCVKLGMFCLKYGICKTSTPSSVCAGMIYLLKLTEKIHVDMDEIVSVSKKSKSTFIRFEAGIREIYAGKRIMEVIPDAERKLFDLMRNRMLRIFNDFGVVYPRSLIRDA